MKTLFKNLRKYTKESVLGPLFKLLEASLELTVPYIIALLIDRGISASDKGFAVKMCVLLVILGAVGLAFSVTAQYFAAKASVGYVKDLRHSLFAHIQTLSHSEIDKIGTSTLITRLTSDANQVQTGLNLALRLLLRSPFVVFGAMILAFTVDVKSAITFAVVIPALSVVVFGIMLITMPLYKKVQGKLDRVLRKTRENLSGVRVIRAFCKEEAEISEFSEMNSSLSKEQKTVGRISSLMNPLTYVLINLALVWLIDIGAFQVYSGNLSQGEVVSLYNYMSQILVELVKLASLIITITKSIASHSRIQSVLEIENSVISGEYKNGEQSEYAVEFSDVALEYNGSGEPAVSSLNFKVKWGETVGIIGGTGSGKSSLINLIPRFYDATDGVVFVDGADVRTYDVESLRKDIGFVPQKPMLFSGTVRENMLWGKGDATDEEIYDALAIAQADTLVKEKGGLDFEIEEKGQNLSGGQKQRLTIARALVKNPKILILDDSSSALDFATDAALRAAIKNIQGKKTIFIVSQRASSIMHADKIIVLDDGKAVGIGKHSELLENCPVYLEIYNSQFKKEA